MKARTQAQRRRRGRPPLPANDREPNGRQSRRKEATEGRIMDVAVSTRIRHLGLVDNKIETAEKQAVDPRRGYVLGRIFLDSKITAAQHEAGVRYADDMSRYYGLTGVSFPSARAQNLFAVRGSSGDDSESRSTQAAKASAKAKHLEALLLAVGDINTGRRVLHTVKNVALLDMDASRGWPDHMHGYLRRGLNKLADHYGIEIQNNWTK